MNWFCAPANSIGTSNTTRPCAINLGRPSPFLNLSHCDPDISLDRQNTMISQSPLFQYATYACLAVGLFAMLVALYREQRALWFTVGLSMVSLGVAGIEDRKSVV